MTTGKVAGWSVSIFPGKLISAELAFSVVHFKDLPSSEQAGWSQSSQQNVAGGFRK